MPTTAEKQYQDTVNRLSAGAGMLDPQAVQKALSDGGSLSNSLGFNSYNDIWGMSPAEVQQIISNRGLVQQQNMALLQNTAQLNDMITGGQENRARQFEAATRIYGEQNEDERAKDRMKFEKELQNDRLINDWKMHDETLKAQINHYNQQYDLSKRGLKIEEDRLDMQRQEIKAIKDSANGVLAGGFNPKDVNGFISTFGGLADKARTAAEKSDEPGDWATYYRYKLQEASMTAPIGSVYDSKSFVEHNGGWPQMQLGPDGNWYGIKRDKSGKITDFSKQPLVTNPLLSLSRYATSNGSNGGVRFYKRYQQDNSSD